MARTRLRGLGSRVTEPRVRVLAVLMQGADPLSHQAVCDALPPDSGIDRVTVYRVLDWLVDSGLAHKNADASRVYRFSAAAAGEHTAHVHFRCEACGGVFCLDAAPPAAPVLPAGFRLSRMDFDLRGLCAQCGARRR